MAYDEPFRFGIIDFVGVNVLISPYLLLVVFDHRSRNVL